MYPPGHVKVLSVPRIDADGIINERHDNASERQGTRQELPRHIPIDSVLGTFSFSSNRSSHTHVPRLLRLDIGLIKRKLYGRAKVTEKPPGTTLPTCYSDRKSGQTTHTSYDDGD